jgi:hypothetical protein
MLVPADALAVRSTSGAEDFVHDLCSVPPREVSLDGGAYYLDAVAAALGCEPNRVWHWGIANRNFRCFGLSCIFLIFSVRGIVCMISCHARCWLKSIFENSP